MADDAILHTVSAQLNALLMRPVSKPSVYMDVPPADFSVLQATLQSVDEHLQALIVILSRPVTRSVMRDEQGLIRSITETR